MELNPERDANTYENFIFDKEFHMSREPEASFIKDIWTTL
jgi:hypothetical protein